MEAIANDAIVRETPRQSIKLVQSGLCAVKARIEAGHLHRAGCDLRDSIYSGKIVRLMKGGEGHEASQCFSDFGVDDDGFGKLAPAMHHTMPDRYRIQVAEAALQPVEQLGNDPRMVRVLRDVSQRTGGFDRAIVV